MNLLWAITDIASGRRRHWNRVCVPILIGSYQKAHHLSDPLNSVVSKLLAAAWIAFTGDFSKGQFRYFLRSIDGSTARELLLIYMSALVQIGTEMGTWRANRIEPGSLWDALGSVVASNNWRARLENLAGEDLARHLSLCYLYLLDTLQAKLDLDGTAEDPLGHQATIDSVLLNVYHPMLLIDLSKEIASQLRAK